MPWKPTNQPTNQLIHQIATYPNKCTKTNDAKAKIDVIKKKNIEYRFSEEKKSTL